MEINTQKCLISSLLMVRMVILAARARTETERIPRRWAMWSPSCRWRRSKPEAWWNSDGSKEFWWVINMDHDWLHMRSDRVLAFAGEMHAEYLGCHAVHTAVLGIRTSGDRWDLHKHTADAQLHSAHKLNSAYVHAHNLRCRQTHEIPKVLGVFFAVMPQKMHLSNQNHVF